MNIIFNVPPTQPEKAYWFIFYKDQIVLQKTGQGVQIPLLQLEPSLSIERQLYLGLYGDNHCLAIDLKEMPETLPQALTLHSIKTLYGLIENHDFFYLISKAKQLLHWDKSTQYCGHCGQKTTYSNIEHAKICLCGSQVYPIIAPVVLALIWRDNEILLARSQHFNAGIYSILAGFVEPGETAEQTVMREVEEEVSIKIKPPVYFGSQPWPFLSNLMLGYFAEYESGNIQIDEKELQDAAWFSIDNLPELPKPISLSRQMIDAHVQRQFLNLKNF